MTKINIYWFKQYTSVLFFFYKYNKIYLGDKMKKCRVVFMGTPDFCVPVLLGLIENYNVIGVVTQPDKIVGRKKEIEFSPIKKVALENNILVLQPEKVKFQKNYLIILNMVALMFMPHFFLN